ncbi:hypothetical protein Pla110_13430 [Polystyrenella longa]|uniref:Uncharacterized protein n=1 Tax=Polystyrenella longa TaxID=2528007 RepID=A0A518CK83_9PLAN|nr:hypothetical protein [Polystyrenella longa]QDU79632.1 hypothetical protein Pla110_13430 [Polystyrenella longa]
MSNSSEILNSAWRSEQVPLLNGILFPNGQRKVLDWDGDRLVIGAESRWDVHDLSDEMTYFTELCRTDVPNSKLVVVAGEGGLGTDGVIALVDLDADLLCWVLFMDSSNPFSHVETIDGQIVARTTLDTTWRVDLEQPGLVTVTVDIAK